MAWKVSVELVAVQPLLDAMFQKIEMKILRLHFYLLFPLECDETIKFTGGSTMAADSNFQACLWFAHSLYSILPGRPMCTMDRCYIGLKENKKGA